jgi:putative FmdB family regulatory protein
MPIYEYVCNECGETFDKMIRFSEADRTPVCPKCESQDTHKKISKIGSFSANLSSSTNSVSSSCGSGGGFR